MKTISFIIEEAILEYIKGLIMNFGFSAPKYVEEYIKRNIQQTKDPEYLIRVINTYFPQYNDYLQKYLILK